MKEFPNDKFEEYLKSQQEDDYIKRLIDYAKNGIQKFPLTKPDIHKGIDF